MQGTAPIQGGPREKEQVETLFRVIVIRSATIMGDTYKAATDLVNNAIEADNNQQYAEALTLYQRAVVHFLVYLKYEKNPSTKKLVQERVGGYMTRAETLKADLSKPKETKKKATAVGKVTQLEQPTNTQLSIEFNHHHNNNNNNNNNIK